MAAQAERRLRWALISVADGSDRLAVPRSIPSMSSDHVGASSVSVHFIMQWVMAYHELQGSSRTFKLLQAGEKLWHNNLLQYYCHSYRQELKELFNLPSEVERELITASRSIAIPSFDCSFGLLYDYCNFQPSRTQSAIRPVARKKSAKKRKNRHR